MTTPAAQSAAMLTEAHIEEWRRKIGNKIFEEFIDEPDQRHRINATKHFNTLCDMALQSLRAGERQAVASKEYAVYQVKEEDAWVDVTRFRYAETADDSKRILYHKPPNTSPPASVRQGMEMAAEICDEVRRDDGKGGQHGQWYAGIDACLSAIRAEAAKLPEGGDAKRLSVPRKISEVEADLLGVQSAFYEKLVRTAAALYGIDAAMSAAQDGGGNG